LEDTFESRFLQQERKLIEEIKQLPSYPVQILIEFS